MSTYAGESTGKKVARAAAYEKAAQLLGPRCGSATVIALAGPEAADIGPIRAFGIAGRPDDVMLVDTERAGLDLGAFAWPGIRCFHGWLDEAPVPWPVDLAILDFCGHPESPRSRAAFRHLRQYLRTPGTVIVVTYLRGRERPLSATTDSVRFHQKHFRGPALGTIGRAKAVQALLSEALLLPVPLDGAADRLRDGAPVVDLTCVLDYQGHASPMGIAVFHVARLFTARRRMAGRSRDFCFDFGKAGPRKAVEIADYLDGRGIDAATALHVSRGRLAAWRAHATRGSYGQMTEDDAA